MEYKRKIEHLAEEILGLLNSQVTRDELIIKIVLKIKATLEFEAVGLRLNDGDDYPYFVSRGFSDSFVATENFLCARDPVGQLLRDENGNAILDCMCGNVIQGRTDPKYPFFTPFGSFWSNCTTELLASTTEDDRQARTRNRCNGEGYESVALIPIRTAGSTHGLIQLNDHRRDMFTLPMIEFIEGLGSSIALLFALRKQEEMLAHQKNDISRLVGLRTKELSRVADTLMTELQKNKEELNEGVDAYIKLRKILEEIKILKGIIPVCSMCGKVRDEEGYWRNIESYLHNKTGVDFSHGVCPGCYEQAMGKMD